MCFNWGFYFVPPGAVELATSLAGASEPDNPVMRFLLWQRLLHRRFNDEPLQAEYKSNLPKETQSP